MKHLLGALLLLIVLATAQQATAGAWTQPAGQSYNRLAVNYFYAERNFTDNGDRMSFANDGEFYDLNLSYYLEYGLSDELTLISSVYYKQIEYEDNSIETRSYGLGDLDLGLKYQLLKLPGGALSLQGLVKIPELYDENDRLPLGNGQYDSELRLLFGQSLSRLFPGYCNVEIGYRWRNEAPSDEFRYLAEVGTNLGHSFYGRIKLDGLLSIGNGETLMDAAGNPTITTEFDLLKLDVTIGYQLTPKWGIEAAYTPALTGEFTAAGATYTLALTYQPR